MKKTTHQNVNTLHAPFISPYISIFPRSSPSCHHSTLLPFYLSLPFTQPPHLPLPPCVSNHVFRITLISPPMNVACGALAEKWAEFSHRAALGNATRTHSNAPMIDGSSKGRRLASARSWRRSSLADWSRARARAPGAADGG